MYCSECGERNTDQARFCRKCGSPLGGYNMPQMPSNAPQGGHLGYGAMPMASNRPRKTGTVIVIASFCVCALVAVGVAVWLLCRPKAVDPLPRKEAVALFGDGEQLVVGKDSTAHLRVRAPQDTGRVVVKDDAGSIVATLDPVDMEDVGDGSLWADVEVEVPVSEPGAIRYTAASEEDSPSGQGNQGGQDALGDKGAQNNDGAADTVFVPVVPEVPPVPVPQKSEDAWILADVCDWIDATYQKRDDMIAASDEVGDALVAHLQEDERVRSVGRYGTTVVFCTTDWSLYGVALQPIVDGMLGAVEDHSLASSGPAIDAFSSFQKDGSVESGLGITAGNTITFGDVLLLNPTPSLMDEASLTEVRVACEKYSDAVGGKVTVIEGDDALPALFGGDLYGKGVVDLRAHGLDSASSETSLMLMKSIPKDAQKAWEDVRADLGTYIGSLKESSPVDVGTLFFGEAIVPDTWRCVVTANATATVGSWNVGVSVSPNLLEWCYAQKPFDNSVLWLSACGSSADTSFAQWATVHGAQLVVGYQSVGEEEDAAALANMLGGLSADPTSTWRSANFAELSNVSFGTVVAQADRDVEDVAKGNRSLFARGAATLRGRVVTSEGVPAKDVHVEAWRYFGNSFLSVGKATTGDDGIFEYIGTPCGRYVVCIEADGNESTYTVVVDEERVDVGDVPVRIADEKPVEEAPAASVGIGNGAIACDGEYYYIAATTSTGTNRKVRPIVVRVRMDKEMEYEVLWEGDFEMHTGFNQNLRIGQNRLVLMATEHSNDASVPHAYSMKLDGSDVVSLACVDSQPSKYGSSSFLVDRDRIVYAMELGDYGSGKWQVRTCSVRGEDDELVCSFQSSASNARMSIAGIDGGYVYFNMSKYDTGFQTTTYKALIHGLDDECQEVVSTTGDSTFVIDGCLYAVEANEVVSYALAGDNRTVVAKLDDAYTNCRFLNASSKYAVVFATTGSGSPLAGGMWRIDLASGAMEQIYGYPEFYDCALELIDDKYFARWLDGELVECGYNLQTVRKMWPPEEGATPVFADKNSPSHEELITQAHVQGLTVLSGTVNVHYEDWYSGRGNVVSITLDEDIDYQFNYKGNIDATAHEVCITTSNVDDYAYWAAYDGQHVTLTCEGLHGAYHDASMMRVDAIATGAHTYLF